VGLEAGGEVWEGFCLGFCEDEDQDDGLDEHCRGRCWAEWEWKGRIPGVLYTAPYLLTLLRRGFRAARPSIILCVKKWARQAPQRRGSSHCKEGKSGRVQSIKLKQRVYMKIPVLSFRYVITGTFTWRKRGFATSDSVYRRCYVIE
jgi:hypothetical protein